VEIREGDVMSIKEQIDKLEEIEVALKALMAEQQNEIDEEIVYRGRSHIRQAIDELEGTSEMLREGRG